MPAGKQQSTVKADIRKNRLTFTFCGWIRKKDLDRLYTDTRFCVADLKPGFHVITDLSGCTFGSLNCLSTYRKIMAFLMEKEAGKVVRITRKSSLIHKQIINISARLQGYKPTYVTSLEEAEQILNADAIEHRLRYGLHSVPTEMGSRGQLETCMLVEISEDDCVVECASPSLAENEEVTLSFSFGSTDTETDTFQLNGTVAEKNHDSLTIRFVEMTEVDKVRLRKALVRKTQQEPLLAPLQQ